MRRFESNCLRKILKVRWYEHISEMEIRRRSGIEPVTQKIKRNRLRYLGHVMRMDENRLPKQALRWRPAGRRRVGRPKETWKRTVERIARTQDVSLEQMEEMAQDRGQWKSLTDLWAS